MKQTIDFLEAVRDYEVDKYDIETYLSNELHKIIDEEFNGSFSTFMQNEVLNEDYGSLRDEVERLYFK